MAIIKAYHGTESFNEIIKRRALLSLVVKGSENLSESNATFYLKRVEQKYDQLTKKLAEDVKRLADTCVVLKNRVNVLDSPEALADLSIIANLPESTKYDELKRSLFVYLGEYDIASYHAGCTGCVFEFDLPKDIIRKDNSAHSLVKHKVDIGLLSKVYVHEDWVKLRRKQLEDRLIIVPVEKFR